MQRGRASTTEPPLPAAGAYRLTIHLVRPARVRVGRLGRLSFPAGLYVYCGSARRALPARVGRHLRRRKPTRWHIDYLLARPQARVVEVRAWTDRTECDIAAEALADGASVIARGLGSSDCRRHGNGQEYARPGRPCLLAVSHG